MQNYNSKCKISENLKSAVDFHGHLGPYLVLGLLMGNLAIKKLGCRKHFGIKAIVKGTLNKPKSCLVDGIQLSTGCTYGKGNIAKVSGRKIQVVFKNFKKNKKIIISFKNNLIKNLDNLKGYKDSEAFAKKLLNEKLLELFELKF